MFPFSRPDPNEPPRPMPRWMTWLLFGFIAYLVIAGNLSRMETPETVPQADEAETMPMETAAPRDYPAIRRAFTLSNWQRAFNPTLEEGLAVRDFTRGKGRPAMCGDDVTLLLSGRDAKGNPFDPAHDETQPLTLRLGAGKSYRAVEQGVIGMQAGGERVIDAPAALVYGKKAAARELSTLQLRVTLKTIAPTPPAEATPLLLTGDPESQSAACGDRIRIRLRHSDAQGNRFGKAIEQHLTLGARELALGLDQALPGIAPGETRLIQLPAYAQIHDGEGIEALDGSTPKLVEVVRLKE